MVAASKPSAVLSSTKHKPAEGMKTGALTKSGKQKAPKAHWSSAEEAELVAVLIDQKALGNSSESGFKSAVWYIVVEALGNLAVEDISSPKKSVEQCKGLFQRVSRLWDQLLGEQVT